MITYQPTEDIEFITRCVTDPAVWRMGSDDGVKHIKPEYLFVKTEGKFWLRAGDLGLFIGEPRNVICYEVHIALLPEAKGNAVEISKGAIEWMFSHTWCQRLTASIPEFNKLAIRLANKLGMEFIGINKKSFLKNGALFDQHLYGISKEDLCRQ